MDKIHSIISAILIFSTMLTFSACGSSTERSTEVLPIDNEDNSCRSVSEETSVQTPTEEVLYREEVYPFSGGCKVSAIARIDNILLIQGKDHGKPIFKLAEYVIDENEKFKIDNYEDLELDEPDSVYETYVRGVTAGKDENFYILTGELPREYIFSGETHVNNDYQGRMAILCYSPEGEFIDKTIIDGWEDDTINGILVDENQNIVIYGFNSITHLPWKNPERKEIIKIDDVSFIMTGAWFEENIIFSVAGADAAYYSYNLNDNSLAPAAIYDDSGQRISYMDGTSICQGLNGELLLNEVSKFWECKSLDKCEQIMRWNYSVSGEEFTYVCRVSEKSFVCTSPGQEYFTIIGLCRQPIKAKTNVNVALVNLSGYTAQSALEGRNVTSGEYQYKILRYTDEEIPKLLTEISAGNSPDLIIYEDGFSIDSDLCEDLYLYIDNDPDISRDSFVPNFLDALSSNGKLPEIWPSMSVNTITIRNSDIDTKADLSKSYYEELVDNSDKYKACFAPFVTKTNLLKIVSVIGTTMFTDRTNGTCNFDNPAFLDMLAWCDEMGTEMPDQNSPVPDVSEYLLSLETISSVDRITAIQNIYGEPFSFVGFPILDSGENYFTCGMNGRMIIPKTSQNKAGAWDFIKSTLTFNEQIKLKFNLPVNMEAFQRIAESALNQNEVELLVGLIESTNYAENTSDTELQDIIYDSGLAYISGDKQLEETIDLIQSRASLYMSERYGQ